MTNGKFGRGLASRKRRFNGLQERAGESAAPDTAPAQQSNEAMRGEAQARRRRLRSVEDNATPKASSPASQDPDTLEAWVRGAFDFAAIGMALIGADGRWLKVNRAFCGIVGYSEREMLGLAYHDIAHSDDLATIYARARELPSGEIATGEMERVYLHRLGHKVPVSLSLSLVRDRSDAPLYFICQVQDVSARRSAEDALFAEWERARATLDSIGDAVLTTDLAGRITYLNAVAERMTGWSLAEASIPESCSARSRAGGPGSRAASGTAAAPPNGAGCIPRSAPSE